MLQIVLVLLVFAMAAVGVTLTGIGGLVADVARVVLIVTLGFTVAAIALARRRTPGFGATSWDETEIPRWAARPSGSEYHLEDEASGSLPSVRARRRT